MQNIKKFKCSALLSKLPFQEEFKIVTYAYFLEASRINMTKKSNALVFIPTFFF